MLCHASLWYTMVCQTMLCHAMSNNDAKLCHAKLCWARLRQTLLHPHPLSFASGHPSTSSVPSPRPSHHIHYMVHRSPFLEAAGGIAVELSSDPDVRRGQVAFQDRLAADSDGMIPKMSECDLRYLALTNNHTNVGLRTIHEECKSPLTDDGLVADGHLAKEKVYSTCPSYKQAVRAMRRTRR